MSIIHIGEVP